MLRSIAAAILAVAALAAVAADDVPKPAAPPAAPPVVKGRLPLHYKALGLSDEQKAKIEAVTAKAHAAIADLEVQVAAPKAAEQRRLLGPAELTPSGSSWTPSSPALTSRRHYRLTRSSPASAHRQGRRRPPASATRRRRPFPVLWNLPDLFSLSHHSNALAGQAPSTAGEAPTVDLSVRLVFVGSGTVCASRLPSRAGCAGSAYARLRRPDANSASPVLFAPSATCTTGILPLVLHRAGRPASCGPSGVRHPAAPRGAVPAPAGPRAAFWAPHRPRHLPSRAGEGGGVQRRLTVVARWRLSPSPARCAAVLAAGLWPHSRPCSIIRVSRGRLGTPGRPPFQTREAARRKPRFNERIAPRRGRHVGRIQTGKERQPRQEDNNRKNPENPEQKGLLPKNNARHRAGRVAALPRMCPERTQPRRRLVPVFSRPPYFRRRRGCR